MITKGHLKEQRRKERRRKIAQKIADASLCAATTILGAITGILVTTEIEPVEPIVLESETINYAGLYSAPLAGVSKVLYMTEEELAEKYGSITASAVEIEESSVDVVMSSPLVAQGTVMYASAQVNVRSDASADSTILGTYQLGTKVEVVEDIGNGWVKVMYKDSEAYVSLEYLTSEAPLTLISSTAYFDYDPYHNASGRTLQVGYSIAGKVAWLGRSVNIYKCNEDGSVGEFMGTYRFDDTGYGAESGVGDSKILDGRTVGTIENGTCIDFYLATESDCYEYGRRNVYIQFID